MSKTCRQCGGNDFYMNCNPQCVPCTRARQLRYLAEDPTRRIINACQVRLRKAHKELGLPVPKNVFSLLGCSKQELLRHLEERFKEGMTVFNFGSVWQMDHRVPISTFPRDPEGIALAAYYKNLRPISVAEHKAKTRSERHAARLQPPAVPVDRPKCSPQGSAAPSVRERDRMRLILALCTVLRASL